MIKRLKRVFSRKGRKKPSNGAGQLKLPIFGFDPEFQRRLHGEPNPDWIPLDKLLKEQHRDEK